MPDLIDRWIEEYEPRIVFLWVNSYWYTYESVPNTIEQLTPVLRPVARQLVRIGARPALNQSPVFGGFRRILLSTVGGRVYFEPEEILEQVESWIHRILRHEEIGLVVRGGLMPMAMDANRPGRERAVRRFQAVDRGMRDLSRRLHFEYMPSPADPYEWIDRKHLWYPDGFHCNAEGHAAIGALEAESIVRAWRLVANSE